MKFRAFIAFFLFLHVNLYTSVEYVKDDCEDIAINRQIPNSHIKIYLPNMPYIYLSKLINGTLVRSADNERGWEFMLATKLERRGELEYIFTLRRGVKFQDGTPFSADNVVENINNLLQSGSNDRLFKKILNGAKKIGKYKVKLTLNKPFEIFLNKLTRINIYSTKYLKKFSWGFKNSYTANNMKEAGKYGLGAYILKKGYATGRKQTSVIELEANPYYYEKGKPYIHKITIFTQLSNDEVVKYALKEEGKLDISIIPFNKKIETILSPFSKLVIRKSVQSTSILFNLLKPNGILKDQKIRLALNQAINQENLLKFVYKNEGIINPSVVSVNYPSVKKAIKGLKTHHKELFTKNKNASKYLYKILNGINLHVVTMENLLYLWKGIEYQLNKYGVSLQFHVVKNEKELFNAFLENVKNPQIWDLLSWSNDSWSSNNPWSTFFHYRIGDAWSAIDKDDKMTKLIDNYLKTRFSSKEFDEAVKKIILREYEKAYMLSIPSPNKVLSVNKEVCFKPASTLLAPLWNTKITPFHWSVRVGEYPKKRQKSFLPLRIKDED